jgi:hypothetical protein
VPSDHPDRSGPPSAASAHWSPAAPSPAAPTPPGFDTTMTTASSSAWRLGASIPPQCRQRCSPMPRPVPNHQRLVLRRLGAGRFADDSVVLVAAGSPLVAPASCAAWTVTSPGCTTVVACIGV